MARGTYILSASNLTLAAQAVTLAFINPGGTASLEILRVDISQAANATSAQQRVQFNTQVTAFPTLTSATPAKTVPLDSASVIVGGTAGAAGTAGVNASAEGAGAKTILYQSAFNVLNGFLWVPTPAETFIMSAGLASGFGVHFPVQPTTLTGWNISVTYREV
jgi:hypothetical protein